MSEGVLRANFGPIGAFVMRASENDLDDSIVDELPVRKLMLQFDKSSERHWCGGDPAMTHILNSYTLLVPGNEGFYIRTLRRCQSQLQDPELLEKLEKFVRQEAQHGVGHRRCWRMLDRQGYRYQSFVKAVEAFAYGLVERITPLKLSVSMVACIEHANAYIGHEFLEQQLLAYSETDLRALFEWHFAEEIEHKGVSYDVLKAVAPSYIMRLAGVLLTLPLFYLILSIGAARLAAQDGSLWTSKFWRGAWQHLWSRDRMVQRTLRHIAAYLRPGFHPWQENDSALASAAIARWSAYLSVSDVGLAPAVLESPIRSPLTAQAQRNDAPSVESLLPGSAFASAHFANANAIVDLPCVTINSSGQSGKDKFSRNWYDNTNRTYWSIMHDISDPDAQATRPCFHSQLMSEMRAFQLSVIENERGQSSDDLAHFVLASADDVFNLGGDLELFAKLIRNRERDRLLAYAELCTRGVHAYHSGFGRNVHTIALVQGDALGGGFEAALSCNTIIAEEGVQMGLPEALFDLFPGMGAYHFIKRRSSAAIAERLIFSGRVFDSRALHEMGIVDVLVAKGQGVAAAEEHIRRNRRNRHTRLALDHIRGWSEPVAIEDLIRTTELWVDTALKLGEPQLRVMDRLVRAQRSRKTAAVNTDRVHQVR
jgi:predicted metal-dependent hydrolase/enoyl-CoA hydratase/carnithine racemase